MITHEQKKLLESFIGQYVQIENDAKIQMDGKRMQLNFAGKLEIIGEEYPGEYYVRVGEDYHAGAMGIGFHYSNLLDVEINRAGSNRLTVK